MISDYLSQIPVFEIPELDLPTQHMFSDTQFEIIKKYIVDFQSGLDESHEVGALLTNFGQSKLMYVTNVSYEKSVLMVFKGYVDGNFATLIQHINQINFMLMAVPKFEQDKPARRIGFTAN